MLSQIKNIVRKFGSGRLAVADSLSATARILTAASLIVMLTCCAQQQHQQRQANSLGGDPASRWSQPSADSAAERQPRASSNSLMDTSRTSQTPKSPPDSPVHDKQPRLSAELPALPKEVRGVYVSSFAATTPSKMRHIQALLDRTELNAVVLDINSGSRLLALPSRGAGQYASADSKGADRLRAAIRDLKRRNVYLIARIVTFKDSALVAARPEWAIRSSSSGKVWRDGKGQAWIDPYKEEAWPYYEAMIAEAAKAGFDEVQFDYVRFPENGDKVDREVRYANRSGLAKSRIISRFVKHVTDSAHGQGLRVSADLFGLVGSVEDDMGIGQRWKDLAPATDVLSPMIYPSHYSSGIWGIRHPDLAPAAIISKSLQDSTKQNKALEAAGSQAADVRPWLQSFTASWIHPHQPYGPKQIREQIRAARNAGYRSYLLWNSSSRYPVF